MAPVSVAFVAIPFLSGGGMESRAARAASEADWIEYADEATSAVPARLPRHGYDYGGPWGGYPNQRSSFDFGVLQNTPYKNLKEVPYAPTLKELIDQGKLQAGVPYLYVIDLRGNIRLATVEELRRSSGSYHSFLVKGENVFGGGMISFESHEMRMTVATISPTTGHYFSTFPSSFGKFGAQFKSYVRRLVTEEYGLTFEWGAFDNMWWK
jgi:hypothetical protein